VVGADVSFRELEGGITRLLAGVSLEEKRSGIPPPITVEIAQRLLRENPRTTSLPGGSAGFPEILKAVAAFCDVKPAAIVSRLRGRTVSFARQLCMYLARKLTHCSLEEIGALFGARHHTTVLYAIERIETLSEKDHRLRADLENLKSRILSTRSGS